MEHEPERVRRTISRRRHLERIGESHVERIAFAFRSVMHANHRLDSAAVQRVVRQAGREISSDYEKRNDVETHDLNDLVDREI